MTKLLSFKVIRISASSTDEEFTKIETFMNEGFECQRVDECSEVASTTGGENKFLVYILKKIEYIDEQTGERKAIEPFIDRYLDGAIVPLSSL